MKFHPHEKGGHKRVLAMMKGGGQNVSGVVVFMW